MSYNQKAGFSNEGFRLRRINPDGTVPGIERQLGFTGSVDLSDFSASDVLSYRTNGENGTWVDLTIDLTGATSGSLADIITAINLDAGFTAIFTAEECSVANGFDASDPGLGRLNIKLDVTTDITDLELKGNLAGLLGIGSYQEHPVGIGTAWYNAFDGSAAIGLPKSLKDFEEIEQESSTGDLYTMIIDAIMKGMNPTMAMLYEDYNMKLAIQGGSLLEGADLVDAGITDAQARYTPPGTDDAYLPAVMIEIYQAKYKEGTSRRSGMTGYKRLILPSVQGRETDLTADVKAWAAYGYDCRATEGITPTGTKTAAYVEDELTLAQYVAKGFNS